MPQGHLPKDLEEIINQEAKEIKTKEEVVVVQTASYVSASPDFDPSKIKRNHNSDLKNNNNKNNNKNNNVKNNNMNNQNKHKKNSKKPQSTTRA